MPDSHGIPESAGFPTNAVELPVGEATGEPSGVPSTVSVPVDPH